ncbi:transposase [Candidatus Magnetoovum chiemensis]|nr:transposase [Candidatus Magnetoovum chiemensis]
MAVSVVRYNAVFKTYFTKRRQDGLPYTKAILATAHKLLRVIFSMLSNKLFFSSDTHSL